MKNKKQICSICREEFTGNDNNAEPFNSGRCCGICNKNVVIPMRINAILRDKKLAKLIKRDETERKFIVYVYDNYHYMDKSYRDTLKFADYDTAIKACKSIVDDFLQHGYNPGMTAEYLYSSYVNFGEDPWVADPVSEFPPGEGAFSAWDYAKEQAEKMCNK
jgi:hypothetical protein